MNRHHHRDRDRRHVFLRVQISAVLSMLAVVPVVSAFGSILLPTTTLPLPLPLSDSSASTFRSVSSLLLNVDLNNLNVVVSAQPLDPSTQAEASLALNSTVELAQTIGVLIIGLVAVAAGLNALAAKVLVPFTAQQMERDCRELAPDLWLEYQAKLDAGNTSTNANANANANGDGDGDGDGNGNGDPSPQTLAQRPDLIQALGDELQPLLDAKTRQIQEDLQRPTLIPPPPPLGTTPSQIEGHDDDDDIEEDDDDDDWTGSQVDLSVLLDDITTPSSSSNDKHTQ